MDINFQFVDSVSEAYKEKLQTFVAGVLAQGLTANRPPRIRFPGMSEAMLVEILMLRRHYPNSDVAEEDSVYCCQFCDLY